MEDEEMPKLGQRVTPAIQLAKQISRYGGSFVVLIHTNELGHKLDFEKRFVQAVKLFAWFDTMREYGAWWSARNKVELDIQTQGNLQLVSLYSPERIKGLPIEIPLHWQFLESQPNLPTPHKQGHFLILPKVQGKTVLYFRT